MSDDRTSLLARHERATMEGDRVMTQLAALSRELVEERRPWQVIAGEIDQLRSRLRVVDEEAAELVAALERLDAAAPTTVRPFTRRS